MGVPLPTSEGWCTLPTSENGGTPLPVKMGVPSNISETGGTSLTGENGGALVLFLPVKIGVPPTSENGGTPYQ